MNKILKSLFLSQALFFSLNGSNRVITFFINDLEKKFKPVDQVFAGLTKKIISPKSMYHPKHVFVAYSGYLTLSDDDGQVAFPQKSTDTTFFMVVCNKIEPILMFPNTIAHWRIPHGAEFSKFEISRIKENKVYYWQVRQLKDNIDKKVPTRAIIIFAKPKNVLVPEGKFETRKSNQLILPNIFIKKDFNDAENALFITRISQFFRPAYFALNKNNPSLSSLNV